MNVDKSEYYEEWLNEAYYPYWSELCDQVSDDSFDSDDESQDIPLINILYKLISSIDFKDESHDDSSIDSDDLIIKLVDPVDKSIGKSIRKDILNDVSDEDRIRYKSLRKYVEHETGMEFRSKSRSRYRGHRSNLQRSIHDEVTYWSDTPDWIRRGMSRSEIDDSKKFLKKKNEYDKKVCCKSKYLHDSRRNIVDNFTMN